MMHYAQPWHSECHAYEWCHHFRHDFTKDVTRPHTSQIRVRQGSQSHGQHYHIVELWKTHTHLSNCTKITTLEMSWVPPEWRLQLESIEATT